MSFEDKREILTRGKTSGQGRIIGRALKGSAPFNLAFIGLSSDEIGTYARPGSVVGFAATAAGLPITPSAVRWSASSDPASAATYGTGLNPTDFAGGLGGFLWLHVTYDGATVSRSVPIRPAPPAAFTAGQWTIQAA